MLIKLSMESYSRSALSSLCNVETYWFTCFAGAVESNAHLEWLAIGTREEEPGPLGGDVPQPILAVVDDIVLEALGNVGPDPGNHIAICLHDNPPHNVFTT
jgi:hypothetical protein